MRNIDLSTKPWEVLKHYNGYAPTESFYIKSFEGMSAADFVFATLSHLSEKKTLVFIVPAEYWKEYVQVFEHSMPITYLLPTDLIEVDKSLFSTGSSESDVRNRLSTIGFVWDKWLQTLIEQKYRSSFS